MVSFIKTFFTMIGALLFLFFITIIMTAILSGASFLLRGEFKLGSIILLSAIFVFTAILEIGKYLKGKEKNEQRS